jgi:hypothetical protein
VTVGTYGIMWWFFVSVGGKTWESLVFYSAEDGIAAEGVSPYCLIPRNFPLNFLSHEFLPNLFL